MSVWTHINGSFRLRSRALKKSGDDFIFPYPDEQMKLGVPRICTRLVDPESGKTESVLKVDAYESSLPVIRDAVKKAIAHVPDGEWDHIDYNVYQSDMMRSGSASYFHVDAEKELFEKLLLAAGYDESDLDEIELGWVEELTYATLTILDDVRYCDGATMMSGLLDFFNELMNSDVYVGDGRFTWADDWDEEHRYEICPVAYGICGRVLDRTGAVLAEKKIEQHIDEDESGELITRVEIIEDENWKVLVPETK